MKLDLQYTAGTAHSLKNIQFHVLAGSSVPSTGGQINYNKKTSKLESVYQSVVSKFCVIYKQFSKKYFS